MGSIKRLRLLVRGHYLIEVVAVLSPCINRKVLSDSEAIAWWLAILYKEAVLIAAKAACSAASSLVGSVVENTAASIKRNVKRIVR